MNGFSVDIATLSLLTSLASFGIVLPLFVLSLSLHFFFGYVYPHGPARACIALVYATGLCVLCGFMPLRLPKSAALGRILGGLFILTGVILAFGFGIFVTKLDQPDLDVFAETTALKSLAIAIFANTILQSAFFSTCSTDNPMLGREKTWL